MKIYRINNKIARVNGDKWLMNNDSSIVIPDGYAQWLDIIVETSSNGHDNFPLTINIKNLNTNITNLVGNTSGGLNGYNDISSNDLIAMQSSTGYSKVFDTGVWRGTGCFLYLHNNLNNPDNSPYYCNFDIKADYNISQATDDMYFYILTEYILPDDEFDEYTITTNQYPLPRVYPPVNSMPFNEWVHVEIHS